MNATKQKQQAREDVFFNEIYKNAKMGADTVINVLPHIKNDALRSIVTMQLDGYEKYATHAAGALAERGLCAKEENFVARGFARIGVAIGTMVDSGAGRIAEILIDGSNMCITEMTKLLNEHEASKCGKQAAALARELVRFEEQNIAMLKSYL